MREIDITHLIEDEEASTYTVDTGFPFKIHGYISTATWLVGYGTSVEAIHESLKRFVQYYKHKAKNVSKKNRRAKKEIAKFNRLAQEYKLKADEFFETHPEYFI